MPGEKREERWEMNGMEDGRRLERKIGDEWQGCRKMNGKEGDR